MSRVLCLCMKKRKIADITCGICKGKGWMKPCERCTGCGMLPGSKVCETCRGKGMVGA